MIVAQRTELPKPASPEDTRERILAAGREVIARKGKRGATTREIAEVAGVNEATLFRHFGTKEALLIAVAEHFCGVIALRDVAAHLSGDVSDDLFTIGTTMVRHLDSQMDLIRWSLVEQEYEASIFAATSWRPQLAMLEVMRQVMQGHIERGHLHGDASRLAMTYMGLLFMHVLARKKFPNSELHLGDTDAAVRFYIDVFLNGVRNR